MSSIASTTFRRNYASAWLLAISFLANSAAAQPASGTDTSDGKVVIDIMAPSPPDEIDPRLVEECRAQEDAAQISGEIVVCREILDKAGDRYRVDPEQAEDRYARETAFRDAPATPNVDGPGIFQGEPTIGKLCIPGLQKCPPPPALMIDVTALPQAPPGSDADRIARGLPPIGNDVGPAIDEAELGLPPSPTTEPGSSPAGSATPAVER